MEYRLICKGRLLDGADEVRAAKALQKLTGLSAREVRDRLLSGRRTKLKSSTDRAAIEGLHSVLRDRGVDVEIESGGRARAGSEARGGEAPRSRHGARWWLGAAVLLLLVVAGLGGYLWHWTRAPLPAHIAAAEAALADGRLVAIAHARFGKLVKLNEHLLGGIDPQALPVQSGDRDLAAALLTGPAQLRERVEDVLLAVHVPADGSDVATSLLLSGRFEADAILDTLRRSDRVGVEAAGPWHRLVRTEPAAAKPCPSDGREAREPESAYLSVGPRWVLLVNERGRGERILERLEAAARADQDLSRWRAYREGRLASLMVLSIPDASGALGGMPAMAAEQAARENAQVSGLAAGIRADLMARGLDANLTLVSDDGAWKREASAEIRRQLDRLKEDSRRVTPTLAGLLSRIRVDHGAEALEIDVVLDAGVLGDMAQVAREAVGSLFPMQVSAGPGDGEPPAEQLQARPKDYSANAAFSTLPERAPESHGSEPLFVQGPFAVDLASIQMGDSGVLEVRLQGQVALPGGESGSPGGRTGELALQVTSVVDASGAELLRDERCVESSELFGRGRNDEPATSSSFFQDKAQVTKHLRLRPGTSPEDIERIRGSLSFTAPVEVRRFELPLRAGESVSHAGMRFYLSRIGESSLSYQVSGEHDRLLEVRALNAEGKALRTGWRMSAGDGGRATQQYQGRVHGVELYVAEEFARHQADFELTGLFAPAEGRDPQPAAVLEPETLAPGEWEAYEALAMSELEVEPRHWHVFDKNKAPVASAHWPDLSLYLTHTPRQWGNSPQAHVYFPMLPELPGVLSAFSYRIDEPAPEEAPAIHYGRISYPYRIPSGEIVVQHRLEGRPVALGNWTLRTGLEANERIEQLSGKLVFRLPAEIASTELALDGLWEGREVEGVTVTLTEVGRGVFPGYDLKIEGDLSRLVNLYGLGADGARVVPDPVNYQQGGYWTMTLPFGEGIDSVELLLAEEQEVREYPFSLRPEYPRE